jgi:hypothetical protein
MPANKLNDANQVERAEAIFRDLLGVRDAGDPAPTHRNFLEAVRQFSSIEFDTSGAPESDGFLFDYGAYRSLPEPGFQVSIIRQFEVEKESGDHDYYVQVRGTYLYAIEPDLEALKGVVSWWFRDEQVPFDDWFSGVVDAPVWDAIGRKPILRFVVEQESV